MSPPGPNASRPPLIERVERLLPLLSATGLVAGGALWIAGRPDAAGAVWAAATLVVLAFAAASGARRLARRQAGVDVIAVAAMAGALALDERLAGAVIALMLSGGAALERCAAGRARRELTRLLERAPRRAHRRSTEGLVDVPIGAVSLGDVLVVKPGEVVPTDGLLVSDAAVLDESAVTGESRPASIAAGATVRSGTTNVGAPLEMRATSSAAASTYAAIIRLVAEAEATKAPFVRMADRYATWLVAITALVACIAWLGSGDAHRALAVVVVATPCPLILAAPAAIVAGLSRAARRGVIVKGGAALEALAKTRVVLFDKTGTITTGRPRVAAVVPFGDRSADEMLRFAGALEQVSVHPFAPAIVAEARGRRLPLAFPTDVREELGSGIAGRIDGVRVALGQIAWIAPAEADSERVAAVAMRTAIEGSSCVFVAVEGRLAGAIVLRDPIRAEAPRVVRALRQEGVIRVHMVTGDHPDVAELVGDAVGADRVFAERSPEEKVGAVAEARADGATVMVGDGVNDAPALALADVGVAMGARGATAASEAADVVLVTDRIEGLVTALRIAKRTRRIAVQSVAAGMALSFVAMALAAAGRLAPVEGALLQEAIDVGVILNALRALRDGPTSVVRVAGAADLRRRLHRAHAALLPRVEALADLADRLDRMPPGEAAAEIERARVFLAEELVPHEQEEQRSAYPTVARLVPGEDPTGPLVRTHQEISRLVRLFGRLAAQLPRDVPQPVAIRDARRLLYGLHAILTLHFAQEDELYGMLEP